MSQCRRNEWIFRPEEKRRSVDMCGTLCAHALRKPAVRRVRRCAYLDHVPDACDAGLAGHGSASHLQAAALTDRAPARSKQVSESGWVYGRPCSLSHFACYVSFGEVGRTLRRCCPQPSPQGRTRLRNDHESRKGVSRFEGWLTMTIHPGHIQVCPIMPCHSLFHLPVSVNCDGTHL